MKTYTAAEHEAARQERAGQLRLFIVHNCVISHSGCIVNSPFASSHNCVISHKECK